VLPVLHLQRQQPHFERVAEDAANGAATAQPPNSAVQFAKDEAIGIAKEAANTVIGVTNLVDNGINAALSLVGVNSNLQTPEFKPSTPGEKAAMTGTAMALLLVPESKVAEVGKIGVALREEKIVKQAETVAQYSDGALMRSARKATGQVEKHLDLLKKSASEAATSIKIDIRHNAERLEAIIREVIRRNAP